MAKTVGMFGGKFLIPHNGHVYMMTKASTMVDELHVIVSYDEDYEKSHHFKDAVIPHVPYKLRLRWWMELTKHLPHVHIHAVYEQQTGQFDDWEKGAEGIKQAIGKGITHVFSSEHEYGEFFEKLYPDAKHVVVDSERARYNISATKIRTEGVLKHWDMIPPVVRKHFVKKVAIVGTESCAKSTLTANLANLYNTNYVSEYGREHYEELGDCVGITLPEDYPVIAYQHKLNEIEKLKDANKILFVDTEAIVTQYYSNLYTGTENDVVQKMIQEQHYDLWLFLEPDVQWVDDGTRTLSQQSIRVENSHKLEAMFSKQGVAYYKVSGSYTERLEKAINLVDKLLK